MNDVSSNSNFVYFTPIYTAVCMPIPRSIFRDKPDATYLVDMNVRIWGTAKYGIAFMCYGEAFYAFGWAGIILCGLLLGIFHVMCILYIILMTSLFLPCYFCQRIMGLCT